MICTTIKDNKKNRFTVCENTVWDILSLETPTFFSIWSAIMKVSTYYMEFEFMLNWRCTLNFYFNCELKYRQYGFYLHRCGETMCVFPWSIFEWFQWGVVHAVAGHCCDKSPSKRSVYFWKVGSQQAAIDRSRTLWKWKVRLKPFMKLHSCLIQRSSAPQAHWISSCRAEQQRGRTEARGVGG